MFKGFQSSVLVVACLVSYSALANPSDNVVADCGDFQVISTIITNPDTGKVISESFSIVTENSSSELTVADARRTKMLGSKAQGATLYVSSENSEKDIYVETIPSQSKVQTFTVAYGKKSATKTCKQ